MFCSIRGGMNRMKMRMNTAFIVGACKSGVSRRNADFQNNIEDTNDMNKYLEAQAVKEPVHWLKAEGKKQGRNAVLERHAEGTDTSDKIKSLETEAANAFVDWLIASIANAKMIKDGTEVAYATTVLAAMTAKELMNWQVDKKLTKEPVEGTTK
ncbi:uncharacterized protein LOC142499617 isoform X2 [Ascaphus truei]|uniref:uncharacterized protein LOC142499617 isoform X2 n=1 Tax=Ascaphus truei TaxID=8439 RepID=UPI003F59554A